VIFLWTRRVGAALWGVLGGTLALALLCAALLGRADPITEGGSEPHLTLEALFGRFASMSGLSARFEEERHLRLLAEPLTTRGSVYFSPPHFLLRRVEDPVESALLIREGEAILRDRSGTRTLPLDLHPMLGSFVDTFALLLAGDLAALRQSYQVRWRPPRADDSDEWEIQLEPLGPPLRLSITGIRIAGQGATVRALRVIEAEGDETRIRFFDVEQRRFGDAELVRLLDLQSP
jgi:hypothetical protein